MQIVADRLAKLKRREAFLIIIAGMPNYKIKNPLDDESDMKVKVRASK